MDAKLKSLNIECPLTKEIVEIYPIAQELPEADEQVQEYVFQFDCPHCGLTHTVNLLDYFLI